MYAAWDVRTEPGQLVAQRGGEPCQCEPSSSLRPDALSPIVWASDTSSPLGLVFIGGPLLDAGHAVRLIDNDAYGWDDRRLADEVASFRPDCVLLGHTGSTAAHATSLATARAIRRRLPDVRIVYGGVFPSYAAVYSLQACAALDVVVRGEGEASCVELLAAWEHGTSLEQVDGITWRDGHTIRTKSLAPADPLLGRLPSRLGVGGLAALHAVRSRSLGRDAVQPGLPPHLYLLRPVDVLEKVAPSQSEELRRGATHAGRGLWREDRLGWRTRTSPPAARW